MPRRKPYTKVVKRNQLRANHVRGMGDVVFKGFQCLRLPVQNTDRLPFSPLPETQPQWCSQETVTLP
jgi:hypothetical protein